MDTLTEKDAWVEVARAVDERNSKYLAFRVLRLRMDLFIC